MLFENVLLLSDIDGTFLNNDVKTVQANLEAVKYFTDNGGLFSVASGRPPQSVLQYIPSDIINFPAIVFNGAAIYDLHSNKYLYQSLPDREAYKLVLRAYEKFRQAGFLVYTHNDLYTPRDIYYSTVMRDFEKGGFFIVDSTDKLPFPAVKYLFVCEPEIIGEIRDFLTAENNGKIEITSSLDGFLEVLAYDTNKGTALKQYKKLYPEKSLTICSIGDYYNDLQILRAADIKAAVKGAPKELTDAVNYVTEKSNNEGAVADFIYRLESLLSKH